jgi:hypothetical protein
MPTNLDGDSSGSIFLMTLHYLVQKQLISELIVTIVRRSEVSGRLGPELTTYLITTKSVIDQN